MSADPLPADGSVSRTGVRLARAAFVVGALYALVSAYWGVGGTALLDTIGGWLERAGRAHNAGLIAVLWLTVGLKLVAASAGLVATRPCSRSRWVRRARVIGWLAAVILAVYGGVLTAVGLLVQADAIHASAGADHRALRWHAYLWDPWFLIWGLLLTAALRRSARGFRN